MIILDDEKSEMLMIFSTHITPPSFKTLNEKLTLQRIFAEKNSRGAGKTETWMCKNVNFH